MAVTISGLASGINWNEIISELITADSAGVNQVKTQQTQVNQEASAVQALSTDMSTVENDVFALEDPTLYSTVTASSLTSGSSWQINAENGTSPGSYTINVGTLASATQLSGAEGIGGHLSSSSDVAGITVGTMNTATAPTAGVFTVDGAQVTITSSESLADVFSAISTATGGNVSASYDPTADKVTMTSASGPLVLGAANDTSNFLQALELSNGGGSSATSAGPLGVLNTGADLSSAGLTTALTGLDGSGNGSFAINGVTIDYNADTDSLQKVIDSINASSAGVTASYDAQDNRMILANNTTGNVGINVSDVSGNLAAALGLTGSGSAVSYGTNATFSVNNGPTQTSMSNNLTSAQLGVTGLNENVNSTGSQTISVATDTTGMSSAIQSFINDFNTLQSQIQSDTLVSTSNGSVTTSILSGENEVGDWATNLEDTVFAAGSGLTSGSIKSLDDLGIDFNGITGTLEVTDSAKLTQALSSNAADVQAFFTTAKTGFGSMVNGALNEVQGEAVSETQNLQNESTSLGDQITTMQTQLSAEQQQLETEFEQMETMYSQYQTESETLSGTSGSSTSSSSTTSSSNTSSAVNNSIGSSSTSGSTSDTSSS